jgi:L-2-hydroxyglutarate oxidase LhgO
MADRIAAMMNIDIDFRIIPFRGEYYQLGARHDRIVNRLIYPVPDPALPFLGKVNKPPMRNFRTSFYHFRTFILFREHPGQKFSI